MMHHWFMWENNGSKIQFRFPPQHGNTLQFNQEARCKSFTTQPCMSSQIHALEMGKSKLGHLDTSKKQRQLCINEWTSTNNLQRIRKVDKRSKLLQGNILMHPLYPPSCGIKVNQEKWPHLPSRVGRCVAGWSRRRCQ